MKRDFDILVCGSSVGCLIAAAILAKRGYKVDVFTKDPEVQTIKRDDFTLRPSNNVHENISRDLFESIFSELDLPRVDLAKFRRCSIKYQIAFPTRYIDVSSNIESFIERLNLEFPSDYLQINCFFKELETRSIQWKRSYRIDEVFNVDSSLPHIYTPLEKFMKVFSLDNKIILQILNAVIKNNTYLYQPQYLGLHLFSSSPFDRRRQYGLPGGSHEFKQFLINVLSSYLKIQVRRDSVLENLRFRADHLDAIQLSSFEGIVKTKILITDKSPWDLSTPGSESPVRITKIPIIPSQRAFSFSFAIEEEALPMGLKKQVISIKDPSLPLTGSNFCILFIKGEGVAPEGKKIIEVKFFLDERETINSPNIILETSTKALENIRQVIPFIDDYTIFRYPDPFGQPRQEPIKGELTFSAIPPKRRKNTWDRYIGYRPSQPIKNILHAGPSVLPSLGFEGEVISGLIAANKATKIIEKK